VSLQTSFLTPPVGFALFYLKGVAPKEIVLLDIYKGVVPFIILQLIGLLLVALFPQVVIWLPAIMYG
jgi:TRAP-type mannitol/chloroaromatic compound transport system permease large subunit